MSSTKRASPKEAGRASWHFRPDVPLRVSPFYDLPLKLGSILKYILRGWHPSGDRFYFLLIAIGIWAFFSPSVEQAAEFRLAWIFEIWVRNIVLVTVVAGGMHLYLFTFRRQQDEFRYDLRAYPAKGKGFLFGNQLWDNTFWTLVPGVAVWTAYEAIIWWAFANGIGTLITLDEHPVLFVGLILITPHWVTLYFYLQHRLLHTPLLYRWVHYRHHRNINLGPWSGLSQHPAEHMVDQADCFIFLLIPAHPVHAIFNLMFHALGASTSHTGYHQLGKSNSTRLAFGDFFHHLHHRYFDCNYGSLDVFWDRLFGTFHDGTEAGDEIIAERRRKLGSRRGV